MPPPPQRQAGSRRSQNPTLGQAPGPIHPRVLSSPPPGWGGLVFDPPLCRRGVRGSAWQGKLADASWRERGNAGTHAQVCPMAKLPNLEQRARVSLPAPRRCSPAPRPSPGPQAQTEAWRGGEWSQKPCPRAGRGRPARSHRPRGVCRSPSGREAGRRELRAQLPADSVPVCNLGRQGQDSPPDPAAGDPRLPPPLLGVHPHHGGNPRAPCFREEHGLGTRVLVPPLGNGESFTEPAAWAT